MKCELDKSLHDCPFWKDGICINENRCSFQEKKPETVSVERPEKWFEKYYAK